ncbi:MAG: S-layer homology domain-containing protein [Oscillospiraceae bacterium]|nr:S-layer homology domain-containing protein [Oscillospiraceae bacterium]
MKNKASFTIVLTFLFVFLLSLTAFADSFKQLYRKSEELTSGFTYSETILRKDNDKLLRVYSLKDDFSDNVRPYVFPDDTIYGGMDINAAVSYARAMGLNVVAAVNADFGYWDTRISCGMAVENGIYKTSPETNSAVGFSDNGAVISYWPKIRFEFNDADGNAILYTGHYNKSRGDDGVYVYSEYFSTVSTRTKGRGKFIRLKIDEGSLRLGGELSLTVTDIISDKEAISIGEGNLIITASASSGLYSYLEPFAVGEKISLRISCSDERLIGCPQVSGCGNILFMDGELFNPEYYDKSILGVNPRTFLGIYPDGSYEIFVADGRSSISEGLTFDEMIAFLRSMGCVSAVNFDGGGSSVMSVVRPKSGETEIVNTPSDGAPRSVCSYILYIADECDAENRLFLNENGAYVYTGSTLSLSFSELSPELKKISLKGELTITPSFGRVAGGKYYAPSIPCEDVISISSERGSGKGTISVVSAPDALYITDIKSGKALTAVSVSHGDKLRLSGEAYLNSKKITVNPGLFELYCDGFLGSFSKDGELTVSGLPGTSGRIYLSLGGSTVSVPLTIEDEFSDIKGHWAEKYINTLFVKKLVSGTGEGIFSPDVPIRRSDFILMLYRAAGCPQTQIAENPFSDVQKDSYYYDALMWGYDSGIAKGYDGFFAPDSYLTREMGMTFLSRALVAFGITPPTVNTEEILSVFSDNSSLSPWAREAAASMVRLGVIEGYNGELRPQDNLLRCQLCKMLLSAFKE